MFTDDTWEATWQRIQTDDGLVHADIPSSSTSSPSSPPRPRPVTTPDWPLLCPPVSGGRSPRTILRDPAWRKKDADGALRVSPADADRLGLVDGDTATLTTKRASVAVTVAVDDTVQPGHVSLPNGLGLDHVESGAASDRCRAQRAHRQRTAIRGLGRRGTRPCRRLERVPA